MKDLTGKKSISDKVAPWIRNYLSDVGYNNFVHCGEVLEMLETEDRQDRKLLHGYFCRKRLCPGCAWRMSVKRAQCLSAIAAAMAEKGRVMLLCTLTVPNVPGVKLRDTIQHMGRSWGRMMRLERYQIWKDNIRNYEITYNSDCDTYHPHMHILIFVPKSYFQGKYYINKDKLVEDWRHATRQPEIDKKAQSLKRCRDLGHGSAILELSKYTAKSADYSYNHRVFDTFYQALYHTRLLTFSGGTRALRDAYRRGELAPYEETEEFVWAYRVVYMWHRVVDDPGFSEYWEQSVEPYKPEDGSRDVWEQKRLDKLNREVYERAQRVKDWTSFLDLQAFLQAVREGGWDSCMDDDYFEDAEGRLIPVDSGEGQLVMDDCAGSAAGSIEGAESPTRRRSRARSVPGYSD